jgi:hypothetical protein
VFFLLVFRGVGQNTSLPLSQLLLKLQQEHGIQISYNEELVKNCSVHTAKEGSVEEKLNELLTTCNLSFERIGEVYIVTLPSEPQVKKEKKLLRGKVVDLLSNEPLPFSTVRINDASMMADVNGMFAYETSSDTLLSLKISYIGYQIKDTVFYKGGDVFIGMQSKSESLSEVVIKAREDQYLFPIENRIGVTKVSRSYASFLPGNRDNVMFNMLRLQPGIMAAGEQTNDFFIWGAYKGQTHVIFDGITLFNSGSLNENISAVNPLIISDMEVYKGGYNVGLNDRVGGVVKITSNQGDTAKFRSTININDQTSSGTFNIPILKKTVLQASFRYSSKLFDKIEFTKNDQFVSQTNFSEINLKYTVHISPNDKIYLGFLSSLDNDEKELNFDKETINFRAFSERVNKQQGAVVSYFRNWKSGGITDIKAVHSRLNSSLVQINEVEQQNSIDQFVSENLIEEQAVRINHKVRSKKKTSVEVGAGIVNNYSLYDRNQKVATQKKTVTSNYRGYTFYKNTIRFNKILSVEPGIKLDFPLKILKPQIQPRIKLQVKVNDRLTVSSAIGRYAQFINEYSVVDKGNNLSSYWDVTNSKPLLSNHYTLSSQFKGITSILKMEGYYRTTSGLSRFVLNNDEFVLSNGDSYSYGLDILFNKEIKQHNFWVSYSFGKTNEWFDYFATEKYERAPHDQRHEFKTGGIMNFRPLYFSYGYVFGSGLPYYYESLSFIKTVPYNRFDISGMYRFAIKNIKVETSISVLNLFNHENVRYNDFFNFPDIEQPNIWGTPLTLVFSLNFKFN